jgi:hypothetical protein
MTISILVEPSQVGFRATTGGSLKLSAEAASAAEAVNALQKMIAVRLERGAAIARENGATVVTQSSRFWARTRLAIEDWAT